MSTVGFLFRFAIAGAVLTGILALQAYLAETEHQPAPCAASRCASNT